jgi:hypothetical protein
VTAWWHAWTDTDTERWLAEVRAAHVDVTWNGSRVVLTPRYLYVPAWVCSDRYQLEQAGVLPAYFRAQPALERTTTVPQPTPAPIAPARAKPERAPARIPNFAGFVGAVRRSA